MGQHYSDQYRAANPYALPDIETFFVDVETAAEARHQEEHYPDAEGYACTEPGWYYWYCLPGCMPDSEPFGPFMTEEEALDDARSDYDAMLAEEVRAAERKAGWDPQP